MTAVPAHDQHGPILLIDDDEFIAGSLRDYLVLRGLTVDVALDPAAAETLMARRQYRVIVVDPYLTGGVHSHASLIEIIRSRQPRSSLLVLTNYSSAALLGSTNRTATLLLKPQSVTDLSEFIQRISVPASE